MQILKTDLQKGVIFFMKIYENFKELLEEADLNVKSSYTEFSR